MGQSLTCLINTVCTVNRWCDNKPSGGLLNSRPSGRGGSLEEGGACYAAIITTMKSYVI